MPEAPAGQLEPKEAMRADCSRCSALCCVAPSFRASAEFAADKAAGVPCPHIVPRTVLRDPRSLAHLGLPRLRRLRLLWRWPACDTSHLRRLSLAGRPSGSCDGLRGF